MSAQLSLFSVGVRPPAYADLEGWLAGPGQVVRRGPTARLSVVLADPATWRISALLTGLAELGMDGEVVKSEVGTSVRTPFRPDLVPSAERWTAGAQTRAPAGWSVGGPELRWWCLAAGAGDTIGFALTLRSDEESWSRIGGALAAAGVPGTLVRPRQIDLHPARGRPAYRIVGRRLRRLAELVGPAPPGAPARSWPEA